MTLRVWFQGLLGGPERPVEAGSLTVRADLLDLTVLSSRDKDPSERCPCVNPFEQLENAFETVWMWKKRREFLVQASAWRRSPDLVPLEAQGLHTASHTMRLREVGLCALLHKHGRTKL